MFLHFQFVHEEALACELAAYFYLEIGEAKKAARYCLLANEKYHEWVSTLVDSSRKMQHITLLVFSDIFVYLLTGCNREVYKFVQRFREYYEGMCWELSKRAVSLATTKMKLTSSPPSFDSIRSADSSKRRIECLKQHS